MKFNFFCRSAAEEQVINEDLRVTEKLTVIVGEWPVSSFVL
jgi:hypothetical protein